MDEAISFTDFDLEEAKAIALATEPARKGDSQLHVQFYKHAELNAFKSREAGRKIFEDHVYIRIMAPANRLNIIETRATDEYKLRFAAQYSRFLQGLDQLAIGTPVSELPTITAAQALELRALKVDTIEQLAHVADTTVQILGTGGQELKQRAIRYLDQTADKSKQGEEIRSLQAQLAEALNRIQSLEKGPTTSIKVTAGTAATPGK